MTVVIQHQPQFVGRLEWWARLARADEFVLVDDVKFERSQGHGREVLGGRLVTLPSIGRTSLICDTQLYWTRRVARKLLGSIAQIWANQKYADEAREPLLSTLGTVGGRVYLLDVVLPVMEYIQSRLGVAVHKVHRATQMKCNAIARPDLPVSTKMAAQCLEVGGPHAEYWCGRAARHYLDTTPFREAGIPVYTMRWVSDAVDGPILDVVASGGWSAARAAIGTLVKDTPFDTGSSRLGE